MTSDRRREARRRVDPASGVRSEGGSVWSLYMVRTRKGSLYTGIATDVDRRLEEHRSGPLGAKYLRSKGPLKLVYRVVLGDQGMATRTELRIKRLRKQDKERIVREAPDADALLAWLGLPDSAAALDLQSAEVTDPDPLSPPARPALLAGLNAGVFRDYYWLKKELVEFCRCEGLPTSGAKTDIADRVDRYLSGRSLEERPGRTASRRRAVMPDAFSRQTVVGPGWRCTQSLRRFFEAELGSGFRFNALVRRLVHEGGVSLGEIAEAYLEDRRCGSVREIEPQLEYNRFVREYRLKNPSATHKEVASSWMAWRALPYSKRPPIG